MLDKRNLALRLVSAIVLGFIVIISAIRPGMVFDLLVVMGAFLAALEWTAIVHPRSTNVQRDYQMRWSWLLRGWIIAGFPYIGATALSLVALHRNGDWPLLVLLFAVVWTTDSFAYGVGRLIGGTRLAPLISPKKTWSGAIGGLLGGIAAAEIVSLCLLHRSAAEMLPVGACLSVLTQAGDLLESWVKRRFAVKDSGWIIPGHGGILDRIDGLLLAAPVFAAYRFLFG